MSVPGIPQSQPSYSVLSTVPPVFASRACDTVETGSIWSSERHVKYLILCYLNFSLGDSQEKKGQMIRKTRISAGIVRCILTYHWGLMMRKTVSILSVRVIMDSKEL